jgi:hypothetical protein
MSVHEYARREAMENPPESGPAMLLELATILVSIATSLRTLAITWHKEQG